MTGFATALLTITAGIWVGAIAQWTTTAVIILVLGIGVLATVAALAAAGV